MFIKNILRLRKILLTSLCITTFTIVSGCNNQTVKQNSNIQQSNIQQNNMISENVDNDSYIEYLKQFNIDLSNMVVLEHGKISYHDEVEEEAEIKFKIKEGMENKVKDVIIKRCGEETNKLEVFPFPDPEQIDEKNIISTWSGFTSGKRVKTRQFGIYYTENNGIYFLYFFG